MAHPLASMVRANLATATRIKYRMRAEDNLKTNTIFHKFGVPRPLAKGHSTQQLHRFTLGAANTVPLVENQIGAGSAFGDTTWTMTPARYGDFVIVTQELADETYSDWVAGLHDALGSRAALSINMLHRVLFDAGPAATDITPLTSTLTRETIGQATAIMAEARLGKPDDGFFGLITSPLAAYDLLFDSSAGSVQGLADNYNQSEIKKGATPMLLTTTAGARIYATTEVAAPTSTTRRTYLFGSNAYAFTHFEGSAPSFGDQSPRNFNLIVHKTPNGSINDPIGRIRASYGYRFSLGVAWLDTVNYRFRKFNVSPLLAA